MVRNPGGGTGPLMGDPVFCAPEHISGFY